MNELTGRDAERAQALEKAMELIAEAQALLADGLAEESPLREPYAQLLAQGMVQPAYEAVRFAYETFMGME